MKEYYLGLDMGTSSVGWAVTDRQYQLLRAKGKDLWGIREFDEANTAAERRTHRTSRRRRQREVARLGFVKDYFHDAITNVDPAFFIRLENSKYHLEHKDEMANCQNILFNDKDYSDKEYFKQYPTIYHLRKELINSTQEHDVRMVYLAVANMFKHRGHFLNAGLSIEGSERTMDEVYQQFVSEVAEVTSISFESVVDVNALKDVLGSNEYSRTQKAEKLYEILKIDTKDKKKVAFVRCLCGLKADGKVLFEDVQIEEDKKIDICFSDYGYEDKVPEILEGIGERNYLVIELLKEMYDIGILSKIMKEYQYLSEARVDEYEKHKKDLKILKKVIKKYKGIETYNKLFRSDEDGSYSAYVNSTNASGKKNRRDMKGRKAEDLYKKVKSLLKDMEDDEEVKYILEEIDKENFLPKQKTSSNGVIPNQVHAKELKKILDNAKAYLPFLNDVDDSGLTTADRIMKLFTFQIPYYIGPTSEKSNEYGNGWVVRLEPGKVMPWNINKKIDEKKTSEEFIQRMVRKCTYLQGEAVLPKTSLEYESYKVLNEINNMRINGEKITVQLKKDIYNELFKKKSHVTKKQLLSYLKQRGVLQDESELSGIDININNHLSTYNKFMGIFGEKIEEEKYKKIIEDIVFWCTIYGDSKKFLRQNLEEKYCSELSENQIKRIIGMKFSDWGRLSKKFLELPGYDKNTGENISLIRAMWENNLNMVELINSDEFTFKDTLRDMEREATKSLADFSAEDLDDYYFSAPVKRMIWQTILIIKEIENVMGCAPKKLFIEMTRNDSNDKKRTTSRKQQLLDLYKNVKSEDALWKKEMQEKIESEDKAGKLRSKKLYLYFRQMGRCMYTGEPIDLDKLFNDNLYDIDHIYPRHFVKDDNIENNLVLVKKENNARKSDTYPIDKTIYDKQKGFWKALREQNFISEEKYKRLTGRSEFTLEQKAGFIARQLVETSQGTKGVADLLVALLPDTKVVYSKASNVSEFRHTFDIPKSRLLNDFHHANDAYLNIVVGNVYYEKFTDNPMNFIKKYEMDPNNNKYNLSRMFDWDVIRNGEIAWVGAGKERTNGTIVTVKKMLQKNTPLLTRLSFVNHGRIAKETLYSARKANAEGYIPLKSSDEKMADVSKYGGFSSVSTAYFFLVEHEKKKKKVRTIEIIPIYLKNKIDGKNDELLRYCTEILGLEKPVIKLAKIKLHSLIKKDGYFMHMSGRSGDRIEVRNAVNMTVAPYWVNYILKIEKYMDTGNMDVMISKEDNTKIYKILEEKHSEKIFSKRPASVGSKLRDGYEKFVLLTIEEQCSVLYEILHLSIIGKSTANLKHIGGKPRTGEMRFNKDITECSEFKLINQSVTGIFESSLDLLTL